MKYAGVAQRKSGAEASTGPSAQVGGSSPPPRSTSDGGPARGVKNPSRMHMTQIVIAFDNRVFNRINSLAHKSHVSFAEATRMLVEWGFESATKGAGE